MKEIDKRNQYYKILGRVSSIRTIIPVSRVTVLTSKGEVRTSYGIYK